MDPRNFAYGSRGEYGEDARLALLSETLLVIFYMNSHIFKRTFETLLVHQTTPSSSTTEVSLND